MSGLFDQITNYSPPLLTAGQVNYKGTWSAASNTPTLVSPPASTSKGDYYVVSAAGTQFGITFAVGDWIISNGTAWEKVDLTDAVSSVFGRTGAITAASGDYTASQVTNVPAGTISSTNVQDAINELSSDIAVAQNVLDAYVTNAESVAITKGQVVYAFGATGNRMSVKLALNTSDSTSAKTIGVVLDSSIGAGNPGYIRLVGVVDGLNLGSYADGDTLYLGATAGSVTNVKPYAPNHLVYVGVVERANNGNGQLYVKVQNGYELDEIHDVQITSAPASGALLVRDATNSLWKAARLTAGTNIAVTNADASVTVGVTGIIGSSNGGTGNGFTKFSGPTTAEKTFTLPDSNATLLYSGGALGTPSSGTLTSCTGLPISTGVSGLGTGIATALAVNTGSAGAPVLFNGALGTPTSGTVTNLTGTASININGTVGATTPSTGAFTTLTTTGKGSIGTTATNEILNIDNGTGNAFIRFDKSGTFQGLIGIAQTAGQGSSGSVAGDIILRSQTNSLIDVAGTTIGKFSSTGLAVTGTLSTLATNGVNVFESAGISSVGLQFKTNSTNRFKIETPSASADLALYAGGTTETVRFTSGGNVGIGGTPSALLHVGATSSSTMPTNSKVWVTGAGGSSATTLQNRLNLGVDTNADYGTYFGAINPDGTQAYGVLGIRHAGSDTSTIYWNRQGNVGIGTTSPSYKLSFGSSVNNSPLFIQADAGGLGMDASSAGVRIIGDPASNNPVASIGYYTGGVVSHANWTNLLMVRQGGNVGIGETSPTEGKLVITNSSGSTNNGSTGNSLYLKAQTSNANLIRFSGAIATDLIIGRFGNADTFSVGTTGGSTFGTFSSSGLNLPNGTNITGTNGNVTYQMLKFSSMGYATTYGTTIVGSASGNNTVCIAVDPSGNSSGSFSGNGSEVLFRNSVQFRTPNAANTSYLDFLVVDSSANVRLPYNLTVTGSLSKGSGSFRIEHPLPEKSATHQLVHSFIEGPQADLIYRGKVALVNGKATVNIDAAATMTEGTFEVLCRDVQCFTTNETGWTAVRGKVAGNILTIEAKDADCADEISWMVIGERQDPHMMETDWTDDNGKVIVEPLKPAIQ